MSAAIDIGPDKQTPSLAQFHQYVELPAELRIKIIQEFIAGLREQIRSRSRSAGPLPFGKFAPLAVIHSEWQHEFEAEPELFGSLCLSTDDLSTYHGMINQHRRDSLSNLTVRVLLNNTAVEYNKEIDHIRGDTGLRSRATGFIVNSMAKVLESVVYPTHNGRQATRSGLELHTQIILPGERDRHGLFGALCSPDGIHCDFSRLPPLHTIRRFSQQGLAPSQRRAFGFPIVLFFNPSSLLTFVRLMPNLEEAVARISPIASIGGISARDMNPCPRLKTLRISTASDEISWDLLATWASCWGHRIENLETCYTHVPAFLRTFVKRDEYSESMAWPNLQVLKVGGCCIAGQPSTSLDFSTFSGDPTETLGAMAVALAWLPNMRKMTIELGILDPDDSEPFLIVIKLHLCIDSSHLSISQLSLQLKGTASSHVPWSGSSGSGGLSFKDRMQDAAAEVQDAVRMHRGHDLEILWPETVEKPQSYLLSDV